MNIDCSSVRVWAHNFTSNIDMVAVVGTFSSSLHERISSWCLSIHSLFLATTSRHSVLYIHSKILRTADFDSTVGMWYDVEEYICTGLYVHCELLTCTFYKTERISVDPKYANNSNIVVFSGTIPDSMNVHPKADFMNICTMTQNHWSESLIARIKLPF